MTGPSWRLSAACRGVDVEVFFPDSPSGYAPAKEVCGGCPVADECLDEALGGQVEHGVWGGLTPAERRRAACPVCGARLPPLGTRGTRRLYCGVRCRQAAERRRRAGQPIADAAQPKPPPACAVCGDPLPPTSLHTRLYCGPRCSQRAFLRRRGA